MPDSHGTMNEIAASARDGVRHFDLGLSPTWELAKRLRRRPITTESIGSAATHPSLRGALATKQSRGHNMRGASNPDRRTAAPGLLRFANKKQTAISLISFIFPFAFRDRV